MLANQIQQHIKRIIHYDHQLYPRDTGIPQYTQINHCDNHIYKLKDKNHMIISIDAEKAFDKIQHPFLIKTLKEWA